MKDIIENTTVPDKWLSVSSYDFYSGGTQLNVAGRERNQNWCGTIITICIYGLMALASWYFIGQFLDTEGPKIEYNFRTEPTSFKFNLKEVETHFFILLSNPDMVIQTKKVDNPAIGGGDLDSDMDAAPSCDPSDPTCQPPCDITVDPTCGGTVCDPGVDPNCCDPATDPFCRRRVLAATEPKFPFLSLDNVGQYYSMALKYEILEYKKTGNGASYQSMVVGNKNFIKCSESEWFKNPSYQDALNQSPFAKDLINDYGICFDIGDDTIVVGDSMSKKSARLSFSVRPCTGGVGTCFADVGERLDEARDLYALVGCFEPAINNSNKANPWDFGINTNHKVAIDPLVSAVTNVYLKKLQTKTDWGLIIEKIEESFKAAIHSVVSEFQSKLVLGTSSGGTPPEYPMKVLTKDSLLMVNYVASRQTEEVKRSYVTLLDLFGQIGGTIDFLIFVITLCFHWYENISSSLTLRKAISDKLKFPERYSKKNASTMRRFSNFVSRKNIDRTTESAIDQMVEEALNVERITEEAAISGFMKKNMYPKELVTLLPTVVLLEKRMEIEDEDKKSKSNKVANSSPQQQNAIPQIQPVDQAGENSPDNEEISLANAWKLLSFEQNDDAFSLVRKRAEKVINEFCSRHKITPEELFAEGEGDMQRAAVLSPDTSAKTSIKPTLSKQSANNESDSSPKTKIAVRTPI